MEENTYSVWVQHGDDAVDSTSTDRVNFYFITDKPDGEAPRPSDKNRIIAEFPVNTLYLAEHQFKRAWDLCHVLNGHKSYMLTDAGHTFRQELSHALDAADEHASQVLNRIQRESRPPVSLLQATTKLDVPEARAAAISTNSRWHRLVKHLRTYSGRKQTG